MNTDISQNNSQPLNTPEEQPGQKNFVKSDGQTSEPQAEVSINQAGLRVEITLSWQQVKPLLQGAKHLIPYVAVGLSMLGTSPRMIQLFYPRSEAPAPLHQADSHRPLS